MIHSISLRQKWAVLTGWLLLCTCLVQAQGWQRFHGGGGNDRAFAIQVLADGGIVAAGSTIDTIAGTTNWYFLKADSVGQLILDRSWGDTINEESALSLLPGANGGWLVCGSAVNYNAPNSTGFATSGAISGIDVSNNPLPILIYEPFTAFNKAVKWKDNYLLAGAKFFPSGIDTYDPRFFYQKIDVTGAILWNKDFDFGELGEAENVLVLPDESAFVIGSFIDTTIGYNLVVVKIGPDGDSLKSKILSRPGVQKSAALLPDHAGNLMLVGTDIPNGPQSAEIRLISLSQNLDSLWTRILSIPGYQEAHAALILPNGNIAIAGEHIPEGSGSRDGFLLLTDSLGELLWFKTYGGLKGDIFWDIKAAPDGNGFIIGGQTASFSAAGDLQAWLLRTDSVGTVWSNRILGLVARDEVENCVIENNETALSAWLVTASGAAGTLYTLTDSLGAYSMPVDTGTWFVSVLPPAGYWSPCEDSVAVDILQFGDSLSAAFPVQALYDCPLLDVDLTTPYLRRCFENTYSVRYFNYGTVAAPNALITITLDPYLSPSGSSLPYTQSGDTLFFSVGQVESLSGGNFQFTALLDCDSTVLGQTHCAEAHIYPDSLCYAFNPEWDGAHLEVDGICMGDSVLLTITNTGLGMQGEVEYIIVEDQIIFKFSTLQLDAGQDTSFVVFPNGSTVTILVQQTPGHPGNNQPMLVVEGCGGFPFSTGFAFQFPQNDGDFSTDIECRQSIGSFDPNDKIGLPEGVGDQHIIAPQTTLEYLIRFQNTGTDTAFRVEILDTLPPTLDLATFREAASSHPYELSVSGQGILRFRFDPIALPDSGANWVASQGFVKFKIAPKSGLAPGTLIENSASIYFDQNTPVITPKTLHTLGDPFQFLITPVSEPVNTNTTSGTLRLSPNPTHGNTLVSLAQPFESEGLRLRCSNATGQEMALLEQVQLGSGLLVDLSTYPGGVYFLELITRDGKVLAHGKALKI